MKKLETELVTSIVTVALAILAVGVFIYYGAHAVFYLVVLAAIIVGFANAWLITKSAPAATAAQQRPAAFVNVGLTSKPKTTRRRTRK